MSDAELVCKPGDPVLRFSLFMEKRVGSLQRILANLEERGVHVLGCTVRDSTEVAIVRMLVSDPETTLQFFLEKGIPSGRCEVLVVELPAGASDLQQMVGTIANAETNIDFLYPLLCTPNSRPVVVIHTDDLDVARIALNAAGYRLLYQQDLSR